MKVGWTHLERRQVIYAMDFLAMPRTPGPQSNESIFWRSGFSLTKVTVESIYCIYEWTKPHLRIPVAVRRGLKKSTGTDTLHCTMNGVSSRHRYSLLDVHEGDASLTFRCGALSEMTWRHLFSTGRHRTSGEPWASGSERLSGKSGNKKPVFKN